jgi:type IX secretion system PorP/SprF family membrane protein
MFNMLNINPAYAGSRGTVSMTALHRNQWVDMPGAPKTSSVSVDMPLNDQKIGIGVQLLDDKIGIERTTGLNVSYAFRIRMSETGTLSLGLQGGMLNYRANYNEVRTFQPNDPTFYQNINGLLPAAAAGIYYNSDKFYIGASTPALLKTKISGVNGVDVSSYKRDMHFYITTGTVIDLSDDFVLKPSGMIKAVSGAPIAFDFNTNLWIQNKIAIGASYRTGDAILGMLEWQINEQIRFGYAFDRTLSSLGMYNQGSHEIMIRFEVGGGSGKIASPRYF